MVGDLFAACALAGPCVEDDALALVGGGDAHLDGCAAAHAVFRDDVLVGGDGPRDDPFAEPEARADDDLEVAASRGVHRLGDARAARVHHALDEDPAAGLDGVEAEGGAVVDRPLGPEARPGEAQVLEQRLLATDEEVGLELSGPRARLGVLFEVGRAHGDVGCVLSRLLREGAIRVAKRLFEGRRERDFEPELPDCLGLLRVFELRTPKDGRDRIAKAAAAGALTSVPRVHRREERGLRDHEPRRDALGADEARDLPEVRGLPADERLELEPTVGSFEDEAMRGL